MTNSPSKHLSSPWTLFKQALGDYKANWPLIVKILLIVIIPVALISTFVIDPTDDTALSAYLTFVQLAMNVAIIYAVVKLINHKNVSVSEAYYDGSGALIRLILVSFLLALLLLPVVLGVLILTFGVVTPSAPLKLPEQILLGVLGIGVSIPGLVLFARAFGAIYEIFESSLGPIKAVAFSRRATKTKLRATLGRMAALGLFLLALLVFPVLVLEGLRFISGWRFFDALLQIVFVMIVLPLLNFYLYRYYKEIKA